MKKLFAFLLAVLMLCVCFVLAAYADMDEGTFDDWYVVVGPSGYRYEGYDYDYDNEKELTYHEYLKPGVKVRVQEFRTDEKKYMMVVRDENFETKGNGIFFVTDAQLEKYFIGEKKPFNKIYTTKLKKAVECIVTPSVGLVLRLGPDRGYPSFKVIPQNTKLTYRYVFKGEEYDWGCVTYKGQEGWVCLDYTEKLVPETTAAPTTEPTTEPTGEATTEAKTEPATVETTETTTVADTADGVTSAPIIQLDAADPGLVNPLADDEDAGFFSNTRTVVLVCCLGAVILALTAAVILLIIKRKKGE